ncbi:hypothetical protein [Rhizobium sp. 18055]|uniref:hypothetical protein n=1 Tax=Rhizobium sp. 18055 TaxID=2681403 RepID=UPI0013586498|nr:hypothetical protein [Rhizobium sp. 18055]
MSKIGFEFPIDASGQWEGFNDSGMEHFTGNPFQHVGREVPQNTLDAKAGNPARIRISLTKIPPSEIPDISSFSKTVDRCLDAATSEKNEKAIKFFESARGLLKKKELLVLQIADSNTTGVKGPCENGRPFFALLKATGQSQKSDTSTGSYGIGKLAPFTVSGLRTVFVSTVWKDDQDTWHHYVQGKSVLMSHYDGKKVRRGTGFWGATNGCMPITSLTDEVPGWLQRTHDGEISGYAGTTLSILGFDAVKDWQDVLTANIVMNFFGAIKRGELEVSIDGSHEINSATLEELLANPALAKVADEQEGETGHFKTIQSYLVALDGGEGVAIENTQNLNLGDCEIRIFVGDGLPKRVAFLRNGMLITEDLPGLKRFGEFKDFVAVLECTSTKGQALMRGMEPPRHDAFEPERLPPDKRAIGKAALKDLAAFVRDKLRRHAQDEVKDITNLDEMADFFADEDDEGDGKKQEENPVGKIVIRARQVKVKIRAPSYVPIPNAYADDLEDGLDNPDDEQPDGDNSGSGEGGTGIPKPNDTSGGDSTGSGGMGNSQGGSYTATPIRDVRAVPLSDKSKRRIAFTPLRNGMGRVQLQDSGADTDRPLKVVASSMGKIANGLVDSLPMTAGERIILEVELDREFVGTIKVIADAV